MRADHRTLVDRVKNTEGVIEELKLEQQALITKVEALTSRVQVLESRAEDSEGRSR